MDESQVEDMGELEEDLTRWEEEGEEEAEWTEREQEEEKDREKSNHTETWKHQVREKRCKNEESVVRNKIGQVVARKFGGWSQKKNKHSRPQTHAK